MIMSCEKNMLISSAVGVHVGVAVFEAVNVGNGVSDGVIVGSLVSVAVGVSDGRKVHVAATVLAGRVLVAVAEFVGTGVLVALAVTLAVAGAVREGTGDTVGAGDRLQAAHSSRTAMVSFFMRSPVTSERSEHSM